MYKHTLIFISNYFEDSSFTFQCVQVGSDIIIVSPYPSSSSKGVAMPDYYFTYIYFIVSTIFPHKDKWIKPNF